MDIHGKPVSIANPAHQECHVIPYSCVHSFGPFHILHRNKSLCMLIQNARVDYMTAKECLKAKDQYLTFCC
jgi:hypothetical protein